MDTYTVKLLRMGGELMHTRELTADSDDGALEQAAAIRHAGPIEIWQGERLIWRFQERFP